MPKTAIHGGASGIRTHETGLTVQTISSRSRYDHFDIAPYMICTPLRFHPEYRTEPERTFFYFIYYNQHQHMHS